MILNMKRVVSTLLLGFFVNFFEEVITEVLITPVNVTVSENQAATLTCALTRSSEAVKYFTWSYKRSSEPNPASVGTLTSTCLSVVVPINTSLYEYACPGNTQSTWTIKKVTRQNHGDRYQCNIQTSSGNENSEYTFIQVQAIPQTLQLDSPPNQDQDLAENAVTLRCRTGCSYPQPSLKWFSTEFGGSRKEWSSPGAYTSTTGGCTDSEKIYTSTLSLAKYSTFPGNLDKTVKFTCGIPIFTGMTQPLFSNPSVNIQFAVKVTSVTLMYGNIKAPSSIKVTSGVSTQFTCTTSSSRPTVTIVWYTGTEKKQGSTSTFTFTPQESDHNKQVYCKAFNTQPENQAVSSNKATLDVQVQVTSVTLKDGNSEAPSLIQVTSGVPKTLTCTTSFSRPRATIIWFLSGKEQTRSNSTFTFTPNNNDHDKQIFCKAFNIQNENQAVSSHETTLYVQVQVSSVTLKDDDRIPSETIIVEDGVSKTLTCTTTVSRPTPTVVWYIGTVERQRSSSNSTFTFIPEDSDNSKQIFCKAFNIQSESGAVVSNKATLNVIDTSIAQTFYIEEHFGQTNVTVDEHDADIQFKCIVNSYPEFDIKIMFEGHVLQKKVNDSSLSFSRHDVSCFDAGVYTCEGRNVYGRKSTENITLFVQCSPRPFRQVERNITGYLYSAVTLSVTVIAYPEPGTKGFAWYKEERIGWFPMLSNADLTITSSGLQSNLKLLNVSKEDYGHYKATVTNSIGTYEQHIFLLEEIVSDVQKADRECNCQTSDKTTALIVGLTVGVVCCIVIMYATYVTILKNRLLREGTKPLDSSGKQVARANPTFASDVTEPGDGYIQQYTDLSRYANTDSNTYDVINKI